MTGVRTLSLIALTLLLAACSKVTPENYQNLELGMDYQEVVKLLGEPDECEAVLNAESCTWGKPKKNIKVRFISDKVVLFSSEGL
ncbi:DUF3862 domain-containing protein [Methylohalobius crimeensis]|uniref:DUF3862 domain-containing protein n=1 Tax=Methylohalobius crimeensis TaxID=244365 RepID=UPI0003B406C3|nr:DUF3862 domain-containing protein [Methylohalobius crimeensis]